MDKQELFKEFAEAALAEWKKLANRRVQVAPHEMFKKTLEGVINPQPEQPEETKNYAPVTPTPTVAPEFPRLLVCYKAGLPVEWIIANSWADWASYHDWYTIFPPQQPASRAITTTLDAEVEKLKAAGVKERPREEWQRRKHKGPSGVWWEGRSF